MCLAQKEGEEEEKEEEEKAEDKEAEGEEEKENVMLERWKTSKNFFFFFCRI